MNASALFRLYANQFNNVETQQADDLLALAQRRSHHPAHTEVKPEMADLLALAQRRSHHPGHSGIESTAP